MADRFAATDSTLHVADSYQYIPRDPAGEFRRPTLAAGAVLWRRGPGGGPEYALIHRPRYDDVSFAKGKVDPGESVPAACARELTEETGLEFRLGRLVGTVTYPVKDRTKVVYYWLAEATGGSFEANDEVDRLEWAPLSKATDLLSYPVDREVLARAQKLLTHQVTSRVLLVRHARALSRESWPNEDDERPLDRKGRRQAELLVPELSAYKPDRIIAAPPLRCQQTAAPLAAELGLSPSEEKKVADKAWDRDPRSALRALREIAARPGVSVVVSQGRFIPGVLEAIGVGANAETPYRTHTGLRAKKASTWLLSFSGKRLVAADYLASPLPAR